MATTVNSSKKLELVKPRVFQFDYRTLLPFVAFLLVYALLPRFVETKHLTLLIYIGISSLLALGLNLLMGYAGQVSLGHAAFFGMGAYASAILTVKPMPGEVIPGFAAGVGLIAGAVALISLTRASGWKLAAAIGAFFILSWICKFTHVPLMVAVLIYSAGMAGVGAVTKLGWWQSLIGGLIAVTGTAITHSFLAGVLASGGTSPWSAMLAGMILTGLIAYLIGGQVLRLKGHYLAMATLGFGIIIEIVFRQWTAVTGGSSDGIFGIPSIDISKSILAPFFKLAELAAGKELSAYAEYYYLVWGFVFVALILAVNIVRSRVGRAFRAVHGSEIAAESLGVDTERYKVQVFVLSAALASVAGSLHAHHAGIGYINPAEFGFITSIQLVVMVVIGGMASVWGAIFGAVAIQLIRNWLLALEKAEVSVFGKELTGLEPIVFGALLVVVMILLPQGLVRGLTDIVSAAICGLRLKRNRS